MNWYNNNYRYVCLHGLANTHISSGSVCWKGPEAMIFQYQWTQRVARSVSNRIHQYKEPQLLVEWLILGQATGYTNNNIWNNRNKRREVGREGGRKKGKDGTCQKDKGTKQKELPMAKPWNHLNHNINNVVVSKSPYW